MMLFFSRAARRFGLRAVYVTGAVSSGATCTGAFGSVTLYVVASGLAFAGGLLPYPSLTTPSLTRPAPVPDVEPTIDPQPGVVP